jgi:hypothetical protein
MKSVSYLFLIVILISCNSKPEDKVPIPSKNKITVPKSFSLTGTNYFFGPKFDSKTCEPVAECDCCSWTILFLDAENFITICPCESEESFLRGTYKIVNNQVILSYDTLQVDREYNLEYDEDTIHNTKPEYSITLAKANITTEILKPMYCDNKLYFTVEADGELSYGAPEKRFTLKEQVKTLKDEGVWDHIDQ